MPPKKKELCCICCQPISVNKDEVLYCSGSCQQWLHRYCASVTSQQYQTIKENAQSFLCPCCDRREQQEQINSLKSTVEALKLELSLLKESFPSVSSHSPPTVSTVPTSLMPAGPIADGHNEPAINPPQSYSGALKGDTAPVLPPPTSKPTPAISVTESERKFNLVLYGIKECPKGTPKHSRMVSDLKSVADILSSVDTQVSQLSIRDNYRLGKYQPDRSRPILVKMTRSSEVSSILSNRRKLTSQPGIFIKADLTPKERFIESLLLKERRSLIDSGIDRSDIKIRGSAIYVKKQKHASVINSVLHQVNPQHSNCTVSSEDTTSVNDLSNENPSSDFPEPRTPPPKSKTPVQSSSQS